MMTTENERWRKAYMHGIESNSKWLAYHGESLGQYVRQLAALPPFETTAEEECDKAIQTLRDALTSALSARAGLLRKRTYLMEAAE